MASVNEQLLESAKANDLSRVQELLKQGANAGYLKHEEGTWGASEDDCPLAHAVQHDNFEMAQLLLQHGADPVASVGSTDWRGCGGLSSVFESVAYKEDAKWLELFLKHGADPNTKSESTTHSMRTDGHSSWHLIHTLIDAQAEKHIVCLLDNGADANSLAEEVYHNERNFNQNRLVSALYKAVERLPEDVALPVATELVRRGANVNFVARYTRHDHNPKWSEECHDNPRTGDYVPSVVCVQITETALHRAVERGHLSVVRMLVASGADTTIARTEDGRAVPVHKLTDSADILTAIGHPQKQQ